MVQVPVLHLASRGICLFCVPFLPLAVQSSLPAGTAPPAHTAQVSAVQTHDQGKTSRNNLLITKTKPKKVIKGQTTPDHSSQIPVVYLNALFPHHRAHWICLLSGYCTSLQLQSFPPPTALPRVNEDKRPCYLPPPPGHLSLLFQKELLSGGALLGFSYF